jgi:hypothetical protein
VERKLPKYENHKIRDRKVKEWCLKSLRKDRSMDRKEQTKKRTRKEGKNVILFTGKSIQNGIIKKECSFFIEIM